MANYYVYSGAVGAGTGADWTNAYTILNTAFSGKAATDVFFVAHDHAESAASVNFFAPGDSTNITKIVCVNRAGSVPPVPADLRATATFTGTSNNNMQFNGGSHYNGCIFSCGAGSVSSANIIFAQGDNQTQRLDNCSLRLGITGAGASSIYFSSGGNTGGFVELNNVTMSFANAAQSTRGHNSVRWRNTPSALLGTMPSQLFSVPNGGLLDCEGVDLSAYSGTLAVGPSSGNTFQWRFADCKLHASAIKASPSSQSGNGSAEVNFLRTGASGVNYTVFKCNRLGTLVEETTIVLTGGASDGTTTISWKVDTAAQSSYSFPFDCPLLAVWNDVAGVARTLTVQGIWGGGAVPNDDEIWVEVRYLSDAASPQGAFVSDGKPSVLGAAAGQAAGAGTWGGSTTKFKLDIPFTAAQKGLVYARVRCAKPSSTFYINPQPILT